MFDDALLVSTLSFWRLQWVLPTDNNLAEEVNVGIKSAMLAPEISIGAESYCQSHCLCQQLHRAGCGLPMLVCVSSGMRLAPGYKEEGLFSEGSSKMQSTLLYVGGCSNTYNQ